MTPARIKEGLDALCQARSELRPTVVKQPFGGPFFNDREVYDALCQMANAYRAGDLAPAVSPPHVYINNGLVSVDVDEYLPRQEDAGFAPYAARIATMLYGADYQLYFSDGMQYFSIPLWRRALTLVRRVLEDIGIGASSVMLEAFTGRYRQTATGIHLDVSDNFSFVLQGQKRMLFWENEAYRARAASPGRHYQCGFQARPEDIASAIVLEAGPGDVMVWPKSYWHTAVSGGTWVTTVNISMWNGTPPSSVLLSLPPLQALLRRFESRRLPYSSSDPLECANDPPPDTMLLRERLESLCADRSLDDAAKIHWAATVTGCGFTVAPQRRQSPLPTGALRGVPESPAVFVPLSDGRVLLSANGHAALVQDAEPIRELVRALNRGETVAANPTPVGLREALGRLWEMHGLEAANQGAFG